MKYTTLTNECCIERTKYYIECELLLFIIILLTIYWPFMNVPHFRRANFPLRLQHFLAWNPLPFYSLLSAFGNLNITTSLFQQPDNYLLDFSSIHSLSCSFGMDFLLPNWTTGNDLSFSISLYKLTFDIPSTSDAWLTDNITGISSKFLYTLSPPFLCSQARTNRL